MPNLEPEEEQRRTHITAKYRVVEKEFHNLRQLVLSGSRERPTSGTLGFMTAIIDLYDALLVPTDKIDTQSHRKVSAVGPVPDLDDRLVNMFYNEPSEVAG